MNNKGQAAIISVVFMLIMGVIIWALGLGAFLNGQLQHMVTHNNLTGIEALIVLNLPLIILFVVVIFVAAVATYGGR